MWDNYIGQQIRRCNRNLLIANLVLLIAVISYATINARYLTNFFFGATDISNNELATLLDPNERSGFILRVKGDRIFDTGIQSVEQRIDSSNRVQSTTVEAEYKVLRVGKKLLVVKADPAASGSTFTGVLVPIPSSVDEKVVSAAIRDEPQLQGMFVPAMLDANDYAEDGWWAVGLGTPLLLLAIWNLSKGRTRTRDYTRHPIYRRLACFGSVPDVVQQIETAILANPVNKIAGVKFFGPWLFKKSFFGLTCFHVPDLVWQYQKVTKHSVNFIPTGKSFAALLYDRYGYSTEIQAGQKKILSMMAHINQQCPWIVAGFDKDLEKLWKSQKGTFIAAVDERRKKGSNAAAAGA